MGSHSQPPNWQPPQDPSAQGYPPPQQPVYYPQQQPPMQYGPPPGYPPQYAPPPQKPKKSHTARNVILASVGVLVLIVVIAAVAGAGSKKKNTAATATTSAKTTASAAPAAATSAAPATTSAPPPPPPVTTFKVGTAVPVDQGDGNTATVTVNAIKLGQVTKNQFEKPDNGQYVVADVTFQCSTGSIDYNPYSFSVSTPDLKSWTSSPGWFSPALNSGTLTAGQAIRGNITFDVAAGAIAGVNLTSGTFDSSVIATWTP